VEGGEHGEFELDYVVGGWGKGYPFVPVIFGDLNRVCLSLISWLELEIGTSDLPRRS
jgi:hypothetical protein